MAPIWIKRWSYQFSMPFKVTLNPAHFGNVMYLLFYNHWVSKPPHMNIVYTVVSIKAKKFSSAVRLMISRLLDPMRTLFET
eukprot:7737777-Ditylum_brightwellii.AAC.1